jgi:hypothetical protein
MGYEFVPAVTQQGYNLGTCSVRRHRGEARAWMKVKIAKIVYWLVFSNRATCETDRQSNKTSVCNKVSLI